MNQPPSKYQTYSTQDVFALVVGSGFSGSLLAWILQRHGRDSILIDQASHPRFAIGESSTPTADFLMRHLAERWDLKELKPLSTYGSWQSSYPELVCGKKRGFAYYHHAEFSTFADDTCNSNSLLVAASSSDVTSDTHWLRSDVDHWLCKKAKNAGVSIHGKTQIETATYDTVLRRWSIQLSDVDGNRHSVRCRWLIDATGGSASMRQWTGVTPDSDWMRTRTSALFGHFSEVHPFASTTPTYSSDRRELFDGDDSAQHHVAGDGWLWALRFGNGVTSLGIVRPEGTWPNDLSQTGRRAAWNEWVGRYPSVDGMLAVSLHVAPDSGMGWMSRLSRCNSHAAGPGWVSLPTAFGFVDPLHSSGIAHALSGVARLAEAFMGPSNETEQALNAYACDVRTELEWIDTFVGLCYKALPTFEQFLWMCNYYFVSAIGFEQDVQRDPIRWPRGYMLCNDTNLRKVAESSWNRLSQGGGHTMNEVRQAIGPWNTVGLLDPALKNRIAHSAANK
jgi:tetracycline 7-halogenase / FADH2 O2-dependent halogenase